MFVTASTSQQIKWTTAKERVCSDSVLRLGKMSDHSEANRRWENQVKEFRQFDSYRELLGINGETMEFARNIFTGFSSYLKRKSIEPEEFTDRINFMSTFNDIDWTRKGNGGNCISNSAKGKAHARRFSQAHWMFLGPGDEKKLD